MARKTELLSIKAYQDINSGGEYSVRTVTYNKFTDKKYVFCTGKNTSKIIECYNSTSRDYGSAGNIGNGSGCAFCNPDNTYYCTLNANGENSNKIIVYAADKLFTVRRTITLTHGATGIAFDVTTNKFYISYGRTVYVYKKDKLDSTAPKYETKFSTLDISENYSHQDICAYNGIIMRCVSTGSSSSYGYIDCYKSSNGDYVKSFIFPGDIQSCIVDNNEFLWVLLGKTRRLIKMDYKFNISDINLSNPKNSTLKKEYGGNVIVKTARKYLGQDGTKFRKYCGLGSNDAWCGAFVWTILDMCGLSKYSNKAFRCDIIEEWHKQHSTTIYHHSGKGSLNNVKPGDIVIFSWNPWIRSHVGFVKKKKDSNNIYTIEGNTSNGIVDEKTRAKGCICGIYRPPYGNVLDVIPDDEENVLEVSVEKLYSSQNFSYTEQEKKESEIVSAIKRGLSIMDSHNYVSDNYDYVPKVLTSNALSKNKLSSTRVSKKISGSRLPQSLNYIEAPFIELTLGGKTFGTYRKGNAPNYINSLNVTKTNGSFNEYTVSLIHQIAVGDNPNYIDELISKNGYDTISIKYGDAEAGTIIADNKAIITGITTNFNFASCNIQYVIKATSSSIVGISDKRNFPHVTDKPSNVIRKLLYDDDSTLLKMFPGMKNKSFVESNGLIPSNDKIVSIDAVKDTNIFSYIKMLVGLMINSTNSYDSNLYQSSYYLIINDDLTNSPGQYFKIVEAAKSASINDTLVYSVDVGYPDDNIVYKFSVDTDYSWALAYDSANAISTYNYSIVGDGKKVYKPSNYIYTSTSRQSSANAAQKNWWTQMTEFPISAKLEVKGLVSPMLLMTYIRINHMFYGNKRVTSGLYIVTGQEDSLSGNGYTTTLSLLRVAGDDELLTIDGRRAT